MAQPFYLDTISSNFEYTFMQEYAKRNSKNVHYIEKGMVSKLWFAFNLDLSVTVKEANWFMANVIRPLIPDRIKGATVQRVFHKSWAALYSTFHYNENGGQKINHNRIPWVKLSFDPSLISGTDAYILLCLFRMCQHNKPSVSLITDLMIKKGFTVDQALITAIAKDNTNGDYFFCSTRFLITTHWSERLNDFSFKKIWEGLDDTSCGDKPLSEFWGKGTTEDKFSAATNYDDFLVSQYDARKGVYTTPWADEAPKIEKFFEEENAKNR
jgi:hypothetical protein